MNSPTVLGRLKLALSLTFFVLCVEAIGGWLANSLALLSDAAHMLTDVLALSLSWLGLSVSSKPSSSTKTFGYHRMEIFAALVNGLLLSFMAVWILIEAFERAASPAPVDGTTMVVVAVIGLMTNLCVMYFLKDTVQHSHNHTHDLNMKSALYHVMGDTLASVAVVIGGVVMIQTGWYWVDPAIAMLVSVILLWGAKTVIADSVHILLEGVPREISIEDVEKELNTIPDVRGIHELHVWCICSNIYALSMHALINDQKLNQTESVLEEIRALLEEKFNITHSTIQFEANPCGATELSCEIRH